MSWHELLPPLRDAVRKLLVRLHAIASEASDAEIARCILLTGERGCGKTTVLMTARSLCARRHLRPDEVDAPDFAALAQTREDLACRLHWLDIIDIEPMPAGTNVLTTLLVNVRAALEGAHAGDSRVRRATLLEATRGDPIAEIERLISDSALVWEQIKESNTVEHAQREVSSAERFMDFRKRLRNALAKAAQALAQREQLDGTALTVVVPVDNINCSAEHLRHVFKLAEWVSSPHLILLMAGDRGDIHYLLERSYWLDLKQSDGRDLSREREDAVLSLARRQAAATARKVLPPEQRIDIDSLTAEQVLMFRCATNAGETATVMQLLGELPLELGAGQEVTLRDLFVFKVPAATAQPSPDSRNGSAAIQHLPFGMEPSELATVALRLTARATVDFWLLLQSACRERSEPRAPEENQAADDDLLPASRVARTMVRLTTAESCLPHWADELIQEKIIRIGADHRTRMVLAEGGEQFVSVDRLRGAQLQFAASDAAGHAWSVHAHHRDDFRVKVQEHGKVAELPGVAGAWLMILHDVLMFAPRPLVIGHATIDHAAAGPSVVTRWQWPHDHRQLLLELRWPMPRWGTFHEHSLMNRVWHWFLEKVSHLQAQRYAENSDRLRRLLILSWLRAVAFMGEQRLRDSLQNAAAALPFARDASQEEWLREDLGALADVLEQKVRERCSVAGEFDRQATTQDLRDQALRDWLRELPRFFAPELATGLEAAHAPKLLSAQPLASTSSQLCAQRSASLRAALQSALVRASGATKVKRWTKRQRELCSVLERKFAISPQHATSAVASAASGTTQPEA